MRVPGGGAPLAWVSGVQGLGALPPPTTRPFGRAAGAHYPLAVGAGVAGVGTRHRPLSVRSCELALRAVGAARGCPGGGASCRCVGRPETGTLPPPTSRPLGRAAGARFPLALDAVCGCRGPAVLGTFSCAAVRCVLCALPGFRAPGGRCGLAPVLVLWLWPAACLFGVPRYPALVRRSSSGPVALGAPGFTGWLPAARGGRPRTGLFVPAAGPCRGKDAWLAPLRTCLGPHDGVVPGGSLRLRSWAACAAFFWRVWTRSLTRPVSRTVRLSTGDSAGAPGLFCVDADPAPFGSEDAMPGSCGCVRVRALLGRVGPTGLPGAFWCASLFLLAGFGALSACSAPSGRGLPCLWLLLGFFLFSFFFFFPSPLLSRPRCLLLCMFSGPGCLGPWRLVAPSPTFFLAPPRFLRRFVISGPGCLGPLRLLFLPPRPPPPPPPFLFCFFLSLFFWPVVRCGWFVCLGPSSVPVCAFVVLSLLLLFVRWLVLCGVPCWAWPSSVVSFWVLVSGVGGAVHVWPRGSPPCGLAWCVLVFRCPVLCSVALCCRVVVCCRALPFVCVVACACCSFLAVARLLCVFWGVVLCVRCALCPVRCCAALCWCPFVVLCASSVLFLVAGVDGSSCRCLLVGVCGWLWMLGVVVW